MPAEQLEHGFHDLARARPGELAEVDRVTVPTGTPASSPTVVVTSVPASNGATP
jgi:hypothetical protein